MSYGRHVHSLVEKLLPGLDELGFQGLVILAGNLKAKSNHDDQDFAFAPTPAFTHFAPVRRPGAAVLIGAKSRQLHLPTADSFWERPEPIPRTLVEEAFEVIESSDEAAVWKAARAEGRVAVVTHDASAPFDVPESAFNPPEVRALLDDLRVHKTSYEVERMREANRIAANGHLAVLRAFEAGETRELRLHLEYLRATDQDDAETPYKNIVAIDENAAILHHIAYRRDARRDARSLLVDAGATSAGYASDITRTWARPGPFRELVARMAKLQDDVIARIEVGKPYESLHDESHVLLAHVLKDFGLWKGSESAAVELGVTRAFFPHGLGHSLGVSVHDVGTRKTLPRPDNKYLRNTSTISVGQVFTIEPGLYFIDSLLAPLQSDARARDLDLGLIGALAGAGGIRIEDNLYVGPSGVENLTRPALPER